MTVDDELRNQVELWHNAMDRTFELLPTIDKFVGNEEQFREHKEKILGEVFHYVAERICRGLGFKTGGAATDEAVLALMKSAAQIIIEKNRPAKNA